MTPEELRRSVDNVLGPETHLPFFRDVAAWVLQKIRAYGDARSGWSFDFNKSAFNTEAEYTTGTIAVSQSGTAVTGASTVWTGITNNRHKMRIGGVAYPITTISGATSITLTDNFAGDTLTAAGQVDVAGTAAPVETDDTLSAAGTVASGGAVSGAAAVTEDDDTLVAAAISASSSGQHGTNPDLFWQPHVGPGGDGKTYPKRWKDFPRWEPLVDEEDDMLAIMALEEPDPETLFMLQEIALGIHRCVQVNQEIARLVETA